MTSRHDQQTKQFAETFRRMAQLKQPVVPLCKITQYQSTARCTHCGLEWTVPEGSTADRNPPGTPLCRADLRSEAVQASMLRASTAALAAECARTSRGVAKWDVAILVLAVIALAYLIVITFGGPV